MINFKTSIW